MCFRVDKATCQPRVCCNSSSLEVMPLGGERDSRVCVCGWVAWGEVCSCTRCCQDTACATTASLQWWPSARVAELQCGHSNSAGLGAFLRLLLRSWTSGQQTPASCSTARRPPCKIAHERACARVRLQSWIHIFIIWHMNPESKKKSALAKEKRRCQCNCICSWCTLVAFDARVWCVVRGVAVGQECRRERQPAST